jgi:hypothetical protein
VAQGAGGVPDGAAVRAKQQGAARGWGFWRGAAREWAGCPKARAPRSGCRQGAGGGLEGSGALLSLPALTLLAPPPPLPPKKGCVVAGGLRQGQGGAAGPVEVPGRDARLRTTYAVTSAQTVVGLGWGRGSCPQGPAGEVRGLHMGGMGGQAQWRASARSRKRHWQDVGSQRVNSSRRADGPGLGARTVRAWRACEGARRRRCRHAGGPRTLAGDALCAPARQEEGPSLF